jgi:hypothetical protein
MTTESKVDRFRLRGKLGNLAQYGAPERVARLNGQLREPSPELTAHMKLHASLSRRSREP